MNRGRTNARYVGWARKLIVAVVLALLAPMPAAIGSGLLIADGGSGGVLEIVEHEVEVAVNNGVAVTTVTQVFQNMEPRQVEALYTFPVPKGGSVANFSMWIKGKEMIGEVVEKKRAREIYESYKRKNEDPGLLEQKDFKTFEMRIFPIAAKARQKVQIAYYQELNVDHDWATYVYPLATTTRASIDQKITGKFAVKLLVKSEVPVVKMDSPSHSKGFVFAKHSDHQWEASLERAGGDLSRDVVLAYRLARPKTGVDAIFSKEPGEDGYFSLTLTAGPELARKEKGMDYVFVLDVSGSMAADSKLAISRNSIVAFIDSLAVEDRFEVITFNVAPNTLFNKLRKAAADAKADAKKFLDTREARGGTVLNPAMQTAYKYGDPDRPLNVVVLSDGMTEQGERKQLLLVIRQRPKHARVFCVGVGNEVNRALLEQVAADAGGMAAFVSRGDNFTRQARAFRRKLTHPVATNVRITFAGGGTYDIEPAATGNLFHGTPIRLYGRYRKPGDVKVTVNAEVAGRPIVMSGTLPFPKRDDTNPEIERMWAWQKVDRLLKRADRAGARDITTLNEIVRLGEAYSIATEYTSFIVLENNAEYDRWKIARRNALRIERDRRKQEQLRQQLETARLATAADLGPMAAARPASKPMHVARPAPAVNRSSRSPARVPTRRPTRRRGWDLDFGGGGGGGGGAIDPVTALIVAGLGFAGLAARRGRKRRERVQ